MHHNEQICIPVVSIALHHNEQIYFPFSQCKWHLTLPLHHYYILLLCVHGLHPLPPQACQIYNFHISCCKYLLCNALLYDHPGLVLTFSTEPSSTLKSLLRYLHQKKVKHFHWIFCFNLFVYWVKHWYTSPQKDEQPIDILHQTIDTPVKKKKKVPTQSMPMMRSKPLGTWFSPQHCGNKPSSP